MSDHEAIMKLQTQATALQRKTDAETQRLQELAALERQVERKIAEQRGDKVRVRSGGVYASKTTTLKATKVHGQLETRRAGLNRKACQMDLENVSVKDSIDSHRKKMGLYNKVYERLLQELEEDKDAKEKLMLESNDSYMQLEDAKRQVSRINLINSKEQADCDRLCDEALAMIHRQNEARSFVDKVTKKRAAEQKAKENAAAVEALEQDGDSKEESQEHVLKSRLRDLKRGAAAQEAHIRSVDLQLLTAEQAFTRLRKVSGLQSTSAVVAKFVANEDENFSLFNFIQQTNDEVVRQEEAVDKLRADMDRFKREKEAKSEHAYEVIHSLKSKRTQAEDRIHQIKSRLAEARLELLQLCTGVSQMFSHIGCSWDVGNDASGNGQSGDGIDGTADGGGGMGGPPGTAGSAATSASGAGAAAVEIPEGGAKPNNILMYIGMIEQRATELIQEFVRLQNKKMFGGTTRSDAAGGKDEDDMRFTFVNPFGPPHPHSDSMGATMFMRTVKRPTLEEAAADLQSISRSAGKKQMVRPLSRFELTSRVMQTLDQRVTSSNGKGHSLSLPSLRG